MREQVKPQVPQARAELNQVGLIIYSWTKINLDCSKSQNTKSWKSTDCNAWLPPSYSNHQIGKVLLYAGTRYAVHPLKHCGWINYQSRASDLSPLALQILSAPGMDTSLSLGSRDYYFWQVNLFFSFFYFYIRKKK